VAESAIDWTDATWNPTTGCDRVSPGCAHCYALDLAARLKRMGQPKYQRDGDPRTSGPGFGVTLHERTLNEPLRCFTTRWNENELYCRPDLAAILPNAPWPIAAVLLGPERGGRAP
jgi:protein gp37